MDQQQTPPGSVCNQRRWTCAIAVALFLFVVQVNAFATEMNVQVAQSTTTVKCANGEHYLALVKASIADGKNDGAFGLALVSAKIEVRMLARYWFFVVGKGVERRDDNRGIAAERLFDVGETLKTDAETFLAGCVGDKEKAGLANFLNAVNHQTSLEDAIKALTTDSLQFKSPNAIKQNLTQELTSDSGELAFSAAMRTALQQHNWSGAQSNTQGDGVEEPNRLQAIDNQLKTMDQRFESIAKQQNVLLTILISSLSGGAVLLVAAFLLSYYKPNWRRKFFSDPSFTMDISRQTADEMQRRVQLKALESHGSRSNSNDNKDAVALEEFINDHFGEKFLKQGVQKGLQSLTAELNKTLRPLANPDANGSLTLNRMQSAREHVVKMWQEYSNHDLPPGALTTLQRDWISLQCTLEPFKASDFEGQLGLARESVALFQYLSGKFKDQTATPADVLREVKSLFERLEKIYCDFTPAEQRFTLAPDGLLTDLLCKLQRQKNLNDSAAETIKTVISDSGTIDEMAAALVKEFQSNKDVNKTKALETSVSDLTSELTTTKNHADQSTQLAGELSKYVHLSVDMQLEVSQVSSILDKFRAGENTHRLLRLRISAAVAALDHAVAAVNAAGRGDALSALRIDEFKDRLQEILLNLEDFTGEALWKKCLSSGFGQRWLHDLLRAELLARTYFDSKPLSLLVAPLTEATTALRATIDQLNVRLPFITLLDDPPVGVPTSTGRDNKLNELPEVLEKVRARWDERKPGENPKFIVDVNLFPYQSDTNQEVGEVVPASSSVWSWNSQ